MSGQYRKHPIRLVRFARSFMWWCL